MHTFFRLYICSFKSAFQDALSSLSVFFRLSFYTLSLAILLPALLLLPSHVYYSYIQSFYVDVLLPLIPYVKSYVLPPLSIYLLYLLFHLLFTPLEYSKHLSPSQKSLALQMSYEDMPPPFPNAWYKYCNDFHLKKGKEMERELFGKLVRLKRNEDGSLPEAEEIGGESRRFPVKESNRIIFIWYHSDPSQSPLWEIPIIDPSLPSSSSSSNPFNHNNEGLNGWVYHGEISHDIIVHIGEIAENGADVAHLEWLHGAFLIPFIPFIRHYWKCTYHPCQSSGEEHKAKIDIYQSITFFGKRVPYTTVHSDIWQVGPGVVQLMFSTPFGRILVQETISPQYSNLQRANNIIYTERRVPRIIAKGLLKAVGIQFERDHPIWNSKRWLRKPLILKSDGPLLKYRRWLNKFYTPGEEGGKLIRTPGKEDRWIPHKKIEQTE